MIDTSIEFDSDNILECAECEREYELESSDAYQGTEFCSEYCELKYQKKMRNDCY